MADPAVLSPPIHSDQNEGISAIYHYIYIPTSSAFESRLSSLVGSPRVLSARCCCRGRVQGTYFMYLTRCIVSAQTCEAQAKRRERRVPRGGVRVRSVRSLRLEARSDVAGGSRRGLAPDRHPKSSASWLRIWKPPSRHLTHRWPHRPHADHVGACSAH